MQLMLVKLMLVGTQEECKEASAYLSRVTSNKFKTSEEWNMWWEMKGGHELDTIPVVKW